VALASLTRDRTAQHLAARRATERLTRLERLLRQMPAALWTTDPALRVDPAGGVSLERLGLAPDADDDAPLPERVRAAGASPAIVEAHRLALEGRSARCEVRVGDAAFVASVEPLRDESGIVGTIGIALDVSPTLEGWRTPPPAVVHVMHAPTASPRPGAAGD
jgi:PAS domain-containing protein